jgi:DNA-binding transcriptional LysR family regulator
MASGWPTVSASEFDWNLTKSFLAVLDTGSLSAASRVLGISQPTLGRHVSEFEASLGVTLFERGREGLQPTEAAITIAEEARRVADASNRLALAAAGKATEVAGTVRITASQVIANYVLPPILGRLITAHPGIEIELVSTNEVENLLRRDADIAIRMVEPSQLDLVARRIAEMPLGIFAHRDYLDRFGRPTVPEELWKHVVIGYDRSDQAIRGFAAIGQNVDAHFFRFRTDDQVAAWEAVRAGVGIGFGPLWLGARDPSLERIAPEIPLPVLRMWLVTHREIRTSARIRVVWDHLASEIAAAGLEA